MLCVLQTKWLIFSIQTYINITLVNCVETRLQLDTEDINRSKMSVIMQQRKHVKINRTVLFMNGGYFEEMKD